MRVRFWSALGAGIKLRRRRRREARNYQKWLEINRITDAAREAFGEIRPGGVLFFADNITNGSALAQFGDDVDVEV